MRSLVEGFLSLGSLLHPVHGRLEILKNYNLSFPEEQAS
jgi:hypothetical protein